MNWRTANTIFAIRLGAKRAIEQVMLSIVASI